MSCPSCPYQPAKLIDLDPNDLVNPSISPKRQQLPPQLHRPSGHPNREDAVGRLESRYGQCAAFVVGERTVWQLQGTREMGGNKQKNKTLAASRSYGYPMAGPSR